MAVSSAVRTSRPLRLSDFIKFLHTHIDGGRRALIAVALFMVALSIVGMHQLSLQHELATPTAVMPTTATPAAAHQRSGGHVQETAEHVTGRAPTTLAADQVPVQHSSLAVVLPNGTPSAGDDACRGCSSHTMAFGACLLALTLLVVSWWLAPPRAHLLPPRLLPRPVTLTTGTGRRVPALSLAELSILRT